MQKIITEKKVSLVMKLPPTMELKLGSTTREWFVFHPLLSMNYLNKSIKYISWEHTRPTMVFFSCKMTVKCTRKAGLRSLWRVSMPSILLGKKQTPWSKVYLCISLLQPFLTLLYTGCFYNLIVKQKDRQTYTQTLTVFRYGRLFVVAHLV